MPETSVAWRRQGMNDVVQFEQYRKQWRYEPTMRNHDPHRIWVCENCRGRSWTLGVSGEVRCTSCNTVDENLKVLYRSIR